MRSLPERRNPLLTNEEAPSYEKLIERRRLGSTELSVRPEQRNTSNATKLENLGPVDYVHLRAPLPEDLSGSEIFAPVPDQALYRSYFLMRRSRDGYVSATGMFKIAFPWAAHAEERAEKEYLQSRGVTSPQETAGNVWITPEAALELADDYGMTLWVTALLDPTDIVDSNKKDIAVPPKFEIPATLKDIKFSPPPTISKSKRGRSVRSSSPSKTGSTKAKASPRKRQTKQEKEANIAHAEAASASLQSALEDAASITDATPAPEALEVVASAEAVSEAVANAVAELDPDESNVRVEVDQTVTINGDAEVTHTNVTVEMPAGLPELPLPEDTEAMLEKAKQMVEEARALEASPKISKKRKVEEVEVSDIDAELPVQPAKRAKVLEERVKRERVRNRAFIGVAASLAVATAIPFFSNFF